MLFNPNDLFDNPASCISAMSEIDLDLAPSETAAVLRELLAYIKEQDRLREMQERQMYALTIISVVSSVIAAITGIVAILQ